MHDAAMLARSMLGYPRLVDFLDPSLVDHEVALTVSATARFVDTMRELVVHGYFSSGPAGDRPGKPNRGSEH